MIIDGVGLGLARNGSAVSFAIFFDQHHPGLPDVPAINETGLTVALPAGGWGIALPKDTPQAILAQVAAALEDARGHYAALLQSIRTKEY